MNAILQGTKFAYQEEKRPFTSITLSHKSPEAIAHLLQIHMIEMIYLGHLLNVDPFDQPQVELYKKKTREILAHG